MGIERPPAAGNHAVNVRVLVQILSSGMQHHQDANLSTEPLRVGSDFAQRCRRRMEQQFVQHRRLSLRRLGYLE